MDAVDATTAWAVGDNGTVLRTTDGGDTRPDMAAISPASGSEGTEVTINGADFGADRGSSSVTFGNVQATEYAAWSDTQIKVKVPAGVSGNVRVVVNTTAGSSNSKVFSATSINPAPAVTAVNPTSANRFAFFINMTIDGSNFQSGASVRLENGGSVIYAYNVNVASASQITCTATLFGVAPGAYDVVVVNPDGQEARLTGGFTVTSACGAGSGTTMLMLGLTLGLLSLAGCGSFRKRRKVKV